MSWLDYHIDDQYHDVVSRINDSIDGGNNSSDNKLQFLQNWKFYNLYRIRNNLIKPVEMQLLNRIHGNKKIKAKIDIFTDPFFDASTTNIKNVVSNNFNSSSYDDGSLNYSVINNRQISDDFANGIQKSISSSSVLLQPQISPLNQKHSFSENNNDLSSSRYPSLSQYLSLPLQPTEQLISSSLQSIVDDEMLHIQQTIKELIEKTNHNNAVNSNNTINNSNVQ